MPRLPSSKKELLSSVVMVTEIETKSSKPWFLCKTEQN